MTIRYYTDDSPTKALTSEADLHRKIPRTARFLLVIRALSRRASAPGATTDPPLGKGGAPVKSEKQIRRSQPSRALARWVAAHSG